MRQVKNPPTSISPTPGSGTPTAEVSSTSKPIEAGASSSSMTLAE